MEKQAKESSYEKLGFEPGYFDLGQARFADLLDPVYEELWDDFVCWTAAGRPRLDGEPQTTRSMLDIYNDESAPKVFQDRAMVEIFKLYGYVLTPWGAVSKFPEQEFRKQTSGDLERSERYYNWLKDLLVYSKDNEVNLVSGGKIYREIQFLFNNSIISESQLDSLLNSGSVKKISPQDWRAYYDVWGSNGRRQRKLDSERFPILADALDPLDVDGDARVPLTGTPLERWALKQLNLWVEAQSDDSIQLPAWMANVDDVQVVKLCRQLVRRLKKDPEWEENFLDWKTIEPVIEYVGWGRLGLDIVDFPMVRKELGAVSALSLMRYRLGETRVPLRAKSKEILHNISDERKDIERCLSEINVLDNEELSILVGVVQSIDNRGILFDHQRAPDILNHIAEELELFQKKTRLLAAREAAEEKEDVERNQKFRDQYSSDLRRLELQEAKENREIEVYIVAEEIKNLLNVG